MEAGKIRALRMAEPFKPFRLKLHDGRQFDVRKPVHLAIAANNSRVLVVTGGDDAVWFPPENVVDAEIIDAASTQGSGGAAT